jgi:hypothetical protein
MRLVDYLDLISMGNKPCRLKTNRIQNSLGTPGDGDEGIVRLDTRDIKSPESFITNGGIRGGTGVQGRIESANVQLATRRGELHGEETTGGLTLADKVLEDRGCIELARALEAHSHRAVGGKYPPVQNRQLFQATQYVKIPYLRKSSLYFIS